MYRIIVLTWFFNICFCYAAEAPAHRHEGQRQILMLRGVILPMAYLRDESAMSGENIKGIEIISNAPNEFQIEVKNSRGEFLPLQEKNVFSLKKLREQSVNLEKKANQIVFVTISKI